MRLLKIKIKADELDIKYKDICEKIGMSYQNFNRCIKENKIPAHKLEQIAGILNVPVGYFFEEGEKGNVINGNGNKNNIQAGGNVDYKASCESLKEKIKGLEKEVKYLKEINELIKNKQI